VQELEEKDDVSVSWELEDLTAGMINSRKLSVKAIVALNVRVETLVDAETAADVELYGEDMASDSAQWNRRNRDAETDR